jgi:hypothetical protein
LFTARATKLGFAAASRAMFMELFFANLGKGRGNEF